MRCGLSGSIAGLHPPDMGRTHCSNSDKGSLNVILRLQLSNSANKNIFHPAALLLQKMSPQVESHFFKCLLCWNSVEQL